MTPGETHGFQRPTGTFLWGRAIPLGMGVAGREHTDIPVIPLASSASTIWHVRSWGLRMAQHHCTPPPMCPYHSQLSPRPIIN